MYEGTKLNIEDVDVCWVVFQQQGRVDFYQQPGVFYRKQRSNSFDADIDK